MKRPFTIRCKNPPVKQLSSYLREIESMREHEEEGTWVLYSLLSRLNLLPASGLTSASNTILLPSGHMTWSTWDLTRSQVSSGVRRLAWNTYNKHIISHDKFHVADRKMLKGAISNSKLKGATDMPDGEYLSWEA